MTALVDTSVLVRYIARDVPSVDEAVESLIDGTEPLTVTDIVLLETAYVLGSMYGYSRVQILDALSDVLLHDNIEVAGIPADIALQGLELCRQSGRVSFADALIWASARAANRNTVVYSLDRRFPAQDIDLRHSA